MSTENLEKPESQLQNALSRFDKNNFETSELLSKIVKSVNSLSSQKGVTGDSDIKGERKQPTDLMDEFNYQIGVQGQNIGILSWIKDRLQEII